MPNQVQVANQPNAVQTVKGLMNNELVKNRFNDILGTNAAGFISSVIQVSNSPTLIGADPKTIMNAAVIAATLQLQIDPNLGQAYIVPYVNKGVKQAQFQLGWRGFYQLALRSNKYKKITTNEVYEGELTIVNRFTEEYKFTNNKTSNKVVGFLAYYKTMEGLEKYLYMSVEEMEAHAKKYSQSYRNDKYNTSQWSQNFIAMGKKTVLKLLLSKYAELSIQQQYAPLASALKFDQSVVSSNGADDSFDIDTFDAEYVDNQEQVQAINPTEIVNARKKAMEDSASKFMSEKNEDVPTIDFEQQ